ncbi:MAG: hypothetical protein WBA73_02250, partial [Devosia sp.]
MLNAARLDPEGMAAGLGISLNEGLAPGTISAAPKQVLAMSDILLATSEYHNNWMIANNAFSTTGELDSSPGDRMAYAGFNDGEPFDWGETLNFWGYDSGTQRSDSNEAMGLWLDMFLDPESRAILLDPDFNEIGIDFTSGLVGGVPSIRAYAIGHDLAASEERFITGGAHYYNLHNVFLHPPTPDAPQAVSGTDGSTTTGITGGYRIAATSDLQTVTIGGVTVSLQMPDENVKLDLSGRSSVRSSHTITLESGLSDATLLGVGDYDLFIADTNGSASITGNAGSNRLIGNWGNDQLNGDAGVDHMEGGYGDDRYLVDEAGDVIVELAGRGSDSLVVNGDRYALAAGVSIEEIRGGLGFREVHLTGNEFGQTIFGYGERSYLSGGGGDDTLHSSRGDVLHGGLGRDFIWGGGGGDRYIYLSAAESGTGGGRDVIYNWGLNNSLFGIKDLIDFSEFDANSLLSGRQGLTFVGVGEATRTVSAGQLKYYQVHG